VLCPLQSTNKRSNAQSTTKLSNQYFNATSPSAQYIKYKLYLLVQKVFTGKAPEYLTKLLMPASDNLSSDLIFTIDQQLQTSGTKSETVPGW